MKITQDFIKIVGEAKIEEKRLTLQSQLTRKEYTDFMKVAELLGLKWNRKEKCHIYDGEGNLQDALEEAIEQGEVVDLKKLFQQYYTPEELAKKAVELAEIKDGQYVLEPSAGEGAIAKEIEKIDCLLSCVEIDSDNINTLKGVLKTEDITKEDFLVYESTCFDKIVMNPPFSKSQDVKHILHAYSLLRKGGRIVSIASSSIATRQGKLYDELRALNPEFIPIDSGAFKGSGTMIKSVFVIINK